ncbi:MAG: Hpt domain-containing protein [Acidimicrobiales bacterium]
MTEPGSHPAPAPDPELLPLTDEELVDGLLEPLQLIVELADRLIDAGVGPDVAPIALELRDRAARLVRNTTIRLTGADRGVGHLPPGSGPQPFRRLPVLVLGDDITRLLVLHHQLERLGCAVSTAASGPEAIELIGTGRRPGTSAGVMIMTLPLRRRDGIGGIETCSRLRRLPGGRGLYIIVLAGAATRTQRARVAPLVDDVIVETATSRVLTRALQRHLDRSDPAGAVETRPSRSDQWLDATRLRSLITDLGDDALVCSLISVFVAEISVQTAAVRAARLDQDPQAVRQLAHQLKGAASSMGADGLHAAACALEHDPAGGIDRFLRAAAATASTYRILLRHFGA